MSKLYIVYNFAQLYRQPIFQAMDRQWDCKWYFGRNTTDIKGMDLNTLGYVTLVDNKRLFGPLETQSGIGKLIRQRDVERMLMLGEPMVWSTWWTLIQRRLFYRKKRIYLWTHGWYGREGFGKKWLKRIFFGMADHVFTYGQYAKNIAISQGFNGAKITPIHNSLNHSLQVALREQINPSDIYKKHFNNNDPTIVFIGRLTHVKRLDLLLNALKILQDRNEHYNLILIGTGEAHDELTKLSGSLNLTDRVWFYGACYDDRENASLIYNADLCVSPGNVGLTAMHTMVFGTPVLTHDDFTMQMPEFEAIQEGKTGSFFRCGDVESLANAISQWFAGHSDRDIVRNACYKEIDTNWTPEYQLSILKSILK